MQEKANKKQSIVELLQIENLERQIEEARPIIEGYVSKYPSCKNCDIYSMKFTGITPGQGSRKQWYECVICGYETYHT